MKERWKGLEMLKGLIWDGGLCKPLSRIMRHMQVPENRRVSFAKRVKLLYTRTPYNSCYMVLHVKNTTFCVIF